MRRKFLVLGRLITLAITATYGKAQGTLAFTPATYLSGSGLNSEEDTRGWAFVPAPFFVPGPPIAITSLGVYDPGGNGLANAHEVGLWNNSSSPATLLASAIVPAGTAAPISNGYRYVQIAPVLVPQASIVLGAQYSSGDADGVEIPSAGQFADRVAFRGSFTSLQSKILTMPTIGVSSGHEGEPNVQFIPVNFHYQVVPEPSTLVFLTAGIAGFLLSRRCG